MGNGLQYQVDYLQHIIMKIEIMRLKVKKHVLPLPLNLFIKKLAQIPQAT